MVLSTAVKWLMPVSLPAGVLHKARWSIITKSNNKHTACTYNVIYVNMLLIHSMSAFIYHLLVDQKLLININRCKFLPLKEFDFKTKRQINKNLMS